MTGPRHTYHWQHNDEPEREPTKTEIAELREARKEIDRLQHRCTALESTVRTISKLAAHYANDRKR